MYFKQTFVNAIKNKSLKNKELLFLFELSIIFLEQIKGKVYFYVCIIKKMMYNLKNLKLCYVGHLYLL